MAPVGLLSSKLVHVVEYDLYFQILCLVMFRSKPNLKFLLLGDASPPGGRGLFGHDGDVSVTSFLAPIPDFGGYDSNLPDSSASQHLNKVRVMIIE